MTYIKTHITPYKSMFGWEKIRDLYLDLGIKNDVVVKSNKIFLGVFVYLVSEDMVLCVIIYYQRQGYLQEDNLTRSIHSILSTDKNFKILN